MHCAELGSHTHASLRPPLFPQQLPPYPSSDSQQSQQQWQRFVCASQRRLHELSSTGPTFTVRGASRRRQRPPCTSPGCPSEAPCRTALTQMRKTGRECSQQPHSSLREIPRSISPTPFVVSTRSGTASETEHHQLACSALTPRTSAPTTTKFINNESVRRPVHSEPELSPILVKAVSQKLQASGLPLWPLRPQRLAVLVRDWELVSVYAEKAWQDDNAACGMCASYICQLLRDLARGTRRMVPVAPELELPVLVSSLEPGGRAENWPFAFTPFLNKIRSLLADWDKQPDRLCPQPKLQGLYLMVAAGVDDVLFWNLGDVQRFACLFCQVSGLPAPKCPVGVWYQLFRDCDDGARTSLCLETAAKFVRHLLERILSFFGSSPEAVVAIPGVLAYKIPPQSECERSTSTNIHDVSACKVPLQVDHALDISTDCPSQLDSSRSEITSPASPEEHAPPTYQTRFAYSHSEATLSPRDRVTPKWGLDSTSSDTTAIKQPEVIGCQAMSEVTSKRFMPRAALALPLEDSVSFFPADLAECLGKLQDAASVSCKCSKNHGEISTSSDAHVTSKGVEIAKEESWLPSTSCLFPKSAEQPPSACEPGTSAISPTNGNTYESIKSELSPQRHSDISEFIVNSQTHEAEAESGSDVQHFDVTGQQASLGEAVTLASALAEVLAAMPQLETATTMEDATLQQVRMVVAQVKACHENISAIAPVVAAQVKHCHDKISSMCMQSDGRTATNCSPLRDTCQHAAPVSVYEDPEQAARQHFANAVRRSREAREPTPKVGMHRAQWFTMCTPSDSDLGTTLSRSTRGRSLDIHNIPW